MASRQAYAATKWVAEHGREIGVDGSRLAVAGNSAGGNLAGVVALMAKDQGAPKLAFQLLLPGIDQPQADQRGEKLRLAVRAILRPDGPLTVSIGIAECRDADETIEALLARADQAMRQAKRDGRDRIVSVSDG